MKPFDYYGTVDVPRPDVLAVRKKLVKDIEDTPMTAAQRKEALGEVAAISRTIVAPEMEKFREAQNAKMNEFWSHCRSEFGYQSFLSDSAVAAVENYAWDNGHSGGFGDVYSVLGEISELARRIADGCKKA